MQYIDYIRLYPIDIYFTLSDIQIYKQINCLRKFTPGDSNKKTPYFPADQWNIVTKILKPYTYIEIKITVYVWQENININSTEYI